MLHSRSGRFSAAVITAFVVLVPLLISEWTGPQNKPLRVSLIILFVATVFFTNWLWVFRPDKRFELARKPVLNYLFKSKFQKAAKKLKANDRFPFRVTIMRPSFGIWGRKMVIAYAFEMEATDPDYMISFPKGRGLCWSVHDTGNIGWYERSDGSGNPFKLTQEEIDKTKLVLAVLSLPLRKKKTSKPHAILNFDALTAAAIEDLRRGKEDLKSNGGRDLLDIATLATMFS